VFTKKSNAIENEFKPYALGRGGKVPRFVALGVRVIERRRLVLNVLAERRRKNEVKKKVSA